MRAPDRLPRSETELAEWSVYADYLMTIGDSLGEVLARDLGMAAIPSTAQLAAFREVAKPYVEKHGAASISIAWQLGHAKEMIVGRDGVPSARGAVEAGATARATHVLGLPIARLLESIVVDYRPDVLSVLWTRLFAALPPTCRRVSVGMERPGLAEIEDFIAMLPDSVREVDVRVTDYGYLENLMTFIGGRFECIDMQRTAGGPDDIHKLAVAARDTGTRVRVQLFERDHAVEPGLVLGGDGDAAIVEARYRYGELTRRAIAIPRWTLTQLQDVHGLIGVNAWLEHATLETHELSSQSAMLVIGRGSNLEKRDGRWRFEGVVIADGATFDLGMATCTFVANDVDRRCRGLLAS